MFLRLISNRVVRFTSAPFFGQFVLNSTSLMQMVVMTTRWESPVGRNGGEQQTDEVRSRSTNNSMLILVLVWLNILNVLWVKTYTIFTNCRAKKTKVFGNSFKTNRAYYLIGECACCYTVQNAPWQSGFACANEGFVFTVIDHLWLKSYLCLRKLFSHYANLNGSKWVLWWEKWLMNASAVSEVKRDARQQQHCNR